jgi:hypothetical protein
MGREAGKMGSAGNGCRRAARFEVTHSEVAHTPLLTNVRNICHNGRVN